MATADSGIIAQKSSKGLRLKLLVVQAIVFVIPFLIISYIFNKNSVTLDSSQMVIMAFILILVLAGLMMLRQIFERFLSMASIVKNAALFLCRKTSCRWNYLWILSLILKRVLL